ncbi:Rrf2 family transcriptional regulator [Pseudomonas sp. CGJS7]|jgi:Rrf2 family protein|uniref:Rrf2 family transcriptional regulator n=1 Tax=Pseudomonas sp. CGJS7 TaxID=3109348 RepID=UPI00300A266F
MKNPERLSVTLHVLLHMAEQPERAMTSEEMAACVGTHPVVIRRSFAGLREAGVVQSVKGHGGGWRLAQPPDRLTLAQIQQALGERMVPLAAKQPEPQCLVVRAVIDVLDEAMREAEQVLDRRLASLTLADLAAHTERLHGRRHMQGGRHGT